MQLERRRRADLARSIDGLDPSDHDGGVAYLYATTTETTYPTTASAVYAIHPVEVEIDESEGGLATFVEDMATTRYAVNIGGSIPPSGTLVVVSSVAGRLVFRYGT